MTKPIKVIHVITRMIIGGAQENTLYTVEGLHRDPRFDVSLVTGPAVGREGDLLDRARSAGLKVMLLPRMRRAIHPIRDLIVLLQLLRIFIREHPSIVHTHSSKAGVLGRIAAKLARVPVIIHTIHGLPFHPYQGRTQSRIYVFIEKLCARLSHKIIVVAHAMRDKCLAQGIGTRSKFIRILSGMDVERFKGSVERRDEMRDRLGFSDDDFVVAKVARLFPLKGHRDVICAAQEVCRRHPDVRFLFLGDGILQEELQEQIRAAGLKDSFVFAGLVPPAEVSAYLAASDMVVHASYREGLARAIPQGLLGGKPVVSYRIDGATEVIEDGINGRLVAPGDIAGLAEAMAYVRQHRGTYANRVADRVPALSEQFSAKRMVEDIIFCYLTFL